MKITWRFKDLIDLEYFLHADELDGDESTRKTAALRDREIHTRHILPRIAPGEPLPRRRLILEWLEQRRDALKSDTPEAFLPGEAFTEIFRLTVLATIVFAIMSGGGLAFSLLRYAGTRPVNVSVYLSLLVGTQTLLILLLAAGTVIRRLRRRPPFPFLYTAFSAILVVLMRRFGRLAMRHVSGRHRSSLEAIFGLIRGKRRIYGTLFYWPLFTLAQMFGVSFNIGVLGATLLRVLGTDIAFGWQSSILFSANIVYKTTKVIAMPWSWFIPPGTAHPTLTQIEGSHMVLKDGIYHLATQDLVSWWPFLCLSVVFYGLIPRLLFLVAGMVFKSRALAKLEFSHSRVDQLLQRMETPFVGTEGESGPEPPPPSLEEKTLPARTHDMPAEGRLLAIIPDDIFDNCPRDALNSLTFKVFGFGIGDIFRLKGEVPADQNLLARLSESAQKNGSADFFILKEAWQPPIREDLAFIQNLRQAVSERARIQVGLIGKPAPDTIFTRVMEKDWKIWHQKITSLGDPYLRLERLVNHEA